MEEDPPEAEVKLFRYVLTRSKDRSRNLLRVLSEQLARSCDVNFSQHVHGRMAWKSKEENFWMMQPILRFSSGNGFARLH